MELRNIFELMPVGLAMVAAVTCSSSAAKTRRKREKFVFYCGTLCSCLLIIAQLSWWTSSVVQGNAIGTWFADVIWTIFNTLVMIAFIALSTRSKSLLS